MAAAAGYSRSSSRLIWFALKARCAAGTAAEGAASCGSAAATASAATTAPSLPLLWRRFASLGKNPIGVPGASTTALAAAAGTAAAAAAAAGGMLAKRHSSSSTGTSTSSTGGSGGRPDIWTSLFGSPEAARRRIRVYIVTLLAFGVPVFTWYIMTRSLLVTAKQLLMSDDEDMRVAGLRRVRTALWTDSVAAQAAELRVDELAAAQLAPGQPEAVMREALETLEALAGFEAGRAGLRQARVPEIVESALRAGWLGRALTGKARGLRDALLPPGEEPAWRRRRSEEEQQQRQRTGEQA